MNRIASAFADRYSCSLCCLPSIPFRLKSGAAAPIARVGWSFHCFSISCWYADFSFPGARAGSCASRAPDDIKHRLNPNLTRNCVFIVVALPYLFDSEDELERELDVARRIERIHSIELAEVPGIRGNSIAVECRNRGVLLAG